MSGVDLAGYLAARRALVDEALERVLPAETVPPATVHRAMRYSVLAGGKRLRPILVLAGAEAVAILAGDALLTLAFRLAADNAALAREPRVLRDVVAELADAAGTFGMVGGQVADIESEGKTISPETLEYIHLHKTAALIRASLRVGALLAGGAPAAVDAIGEAGRDLGLAFQIVDDILDVEGSLEELGKTAGSDERKKKATYPALHGVPASRREAQRLVARVKERLAALGPRAAPLAGLADYVLERKN